MGEKEGTTMTTTKLAPVSSTAKVYCPMCTHTVDATVEHHPRHAYVKRGQKCPRCSGSLDAGYIMYLERAA
jgi:DNA replicative helicase MCM subunit Mcm2 (Cdc46/Mcm family)